MNLKFAVGLTHNPSVVEGATRPKLLETGQEIPVAVLAARAVVAK